MPEARLVEEGLQDESMLAGPPAWRSRSRNLTSVAERERKAQQVCSVSGHSALDFAV